MASFCAVKCAISQKNGKVNRRFSQFYNDIIKGAQAPCVANNGKFERILCRTVVHACAIFRKVAKFRRQDGGTFWSHYKTISFHQEHCQDYSDCNKPENAWYDTFVAPKYIILQAFNNCFHGFRLDNGIRYKMWSSDNVVFFLMPTMQYLHSLKINCAISDLLEGRSFSYLLDLYLLVYLLLYILTCA